MISVWNVDLNKKIMEIKNSKIAIGWSDTVWCYSWKITLVIHFFLISIFCSILHYLTKYGLRGVNYCMFWEQGGGVLNKMKKI